MSRELQGQKILVAGGAGYIGAHVCKAVAEAGGTPVTLDDLSAGHAHAVQWGPLVEVDLRDRHATLDALSAYHDATAVVHLASSIEVGLGERDPAGFYDNNVLGALNLLHAMRETGLNQLVFSSTCATYGEDLDMPLTESSVQNPVSVYGKTKLAIEHMIQSFHNAYGLRYVTFRYFNACGADASGLIGEEHDPETHLIPLAIGAALHPSANGAPQLKVFGTDYDTPDGTCLRDYVHVTDIAHAHILALTAMENGLDAAELNIGTGEGRSVLEIIRGVEAATGCPLPYAEAPRRAGDISALFADPSRAREVIGFETRHSDLDTILRTAVAFHSRLGDRLGDSLGDGSS
jgi:UDP-arabinose 4-epimerase